MLDAWAVLALLRAEAAGPGVRDWVARGETVMSWVNAGEVCYLEARRIGWGRARRALDAVRSVVRLEEPDEPLVMAAARLKADHPISYADCFAVATAQRHAAPLLTGDPELVALRGVEVVDLRSRA